MKKLALTMSAFAAAVAIAAPALAQPPIATTTTLTISPNPVNVGDPATVTGTVATPTGGKLRVKRFLVDGFHVSCEAYEAAVSGQSEDILVELEPVNEGANLGVFSIAYTGADTSVAGSYSYAAQYVPSGGSGYSQSQSGCFNMVVQETCSPSGLSISVNESYGATTGLPGTTYNGGFDVVVKNCGPGDKLGVTAQGGTSGWTDFCQATADAGTSWVIRNQNKRNEVLLWTIGDMPEGTQKTLRVCLTGDIKPSATPGTILFLSGPWSALSEGIKTDYTGRVSITVASPTP
jgi:hypothetical protein